MEPRAGAGFERLRGIVWVDEAGEVLRQAAHLHEAAFFEAAEFAGRGGGLALRGRVGGRAKLQPVEADGFVRPHVVAAEALGAAVEAPRQLAASAGGGGVGHVEQLARPFGGDERGVGLRGIPAVGVGVPSLAIEVEQLRLDAAGARGFAAFHLQRERACEDGVGREMPHEAVDDAPRVGRGDDAVTGDGEVMLGDRAVVPHQRGRRPRLHAGRGCEGLERGEEAGLGELAGEGQIRGRRGVRHEAPDAALVIEDEQLAVGVLGEGDGFQHRVAEFVVGEKFVAVVTQRPEFARLPIAEDVCALELGKFLAVVEATAGHTRAFAVRDGNHRRQDGAGAGLDVGADAGVRAFGDGPAVVAAALHAVNHFPLLPAHVADPQHSVRPERGAERVTEAEGPHLAARAGRGDEGIVLGHGVVVRAFGAVHVNAQDGREQVGDVLAGLAQVVGRVRLGSVAGGNVEVAVGAEGEGAAVVAAAEPADDGVLARGVEAQRVERRGGEARDARAIHLVEALIVVEENEAVRREAGVEGEAQRSRRRAELAAVENEVGVRHARARAEGNELAALLQHHPAVAAGLAHEVHGLGEFELWEDALDIERRGWVRRAGDAGGGPWRARRGMRGTGEETKECEEKA